MQEWKLVERESIRPAPPPPQRLFVEKMVEMREQGKQLYERVAQVISSHKTWRETS